MKAHMAVTDQKLEWYGIAIRDAHLLSTGQIEEQFAPLKQQMREALAPFREKSEATHTCVGVVNDKHNGFTFYATRAAAEAVATAMPCQVIVAPDGERIPSANAAEIAKRPIRPLVSKRKSQQFV
jgi:hypothetical protein